MKCKWDKCEEVAETSLAELQATQDSTPGTPIQSLRSMKFILLLCFKRKKNGKKGEREDYSPILDSEKGLPQRGRESGPPATVTIKYHQCVSPLEKPGSRGYKSQDGCPSQSYPEGPESSEALSRHGVKEM